MQRLRACVRDSLSVSQKVRDGVCMCNSVSVCVCVCGVMGPRTNISAEEEKKKEEEEEVEEGGGCLGDDRPHERSACLGSGMKLKAKKKKKQCRQFLA